MESNKKKYDAVNFKSNGILKYTPENSISPIAMYWLVFKIVFFEIIKSDKKNIKYMPSWELKLVIKKYWFFKASIITNDTIIATITWANFVNLKNLIII